MKRDYAVTFLVTVAIMASYLATLRLVAQHIGPAGFGAYALLRRTVGLLAPVTILGADNAGARLVAFAIGGGRPVRAYLPASLIVMTASSSVAAAALILFRSTFAQLLFGSEQYISLVLILPPLMFGVGLYSVGYDYLRGRAQFVAANCFSLVIQAIVPLASVLAGGSVERVVLTMAVCWIAISLAVLSLIPMSIIGLRPCVREVIRYGVPRAPGDLLQLGLLAAPAIIATHLADLRVAGLVALGISALTMVGSGVSPIAFILLPFSARKLGAGQVESLRRHVLNILQVVVVIIALGTVLVEAFATQLVRLYLGPDFAAGSYVVRIMLLGAVPYAVYFTLKSVVDAQHIRAINTRNMLAASMTFVIAVGIADIIRLTVPAVLAALVASLYVLSALTTLEAMKALRTVPTASGGQGP